MLSNSTNFACQLLVATNNCDVLVISPYSKWCSSMTKHMIQYFAFFIIWATHLQEQNSDETCMKEFISEWDNK